MGEISNLFHSPRANKFASSFYGFSSKSTSLKRVANNRKCLEIALAICNNDTNRGGVWHEFSIPKTRNLIFEFLIRIRGNNLSLHLPRTFQDDRKSWKMSRILSPGFDFTPNFQCFRRKSYMSVVGGRWEV
jgi:hypothetical protein